MTRLLAALLVLSLLAPAQSDTAQQAIARSMSAVQRSERLRYSYTFKKQELTRVLDAAGGLKATHSTVNEIMYFAGKPYDHLLEKDGKPLPSAEAEKQEQKMRRAAEEAGKLTEEEKVARLNKLDRERVKDTEIFTFVPAAYDFTMRPERTLNGRPAYVIDAFPKPGYSGKYSSIFHKTKGTFFVDKQDYTLVRIEADILENISFGFLLFSLSKGTHITFEQTRVNDEVWFPKSLTVRYTARALVKTLRGEVVTTYSDYRKYQSDSRIVSTGAVQ